MADTGLVRWKERAAFLFVCALLAAYAASWVLGGAAAKDAGGNAARAQRYVLAGGEQLSLPDAQSVFAAKGSSAYFDNSLPTRWVEPKVAVEETKPVELAPPAPSFPEPPMLLPVPGPTVEFTSGMPRWPGFPDAVTTTP